MVICKYYLQGCCSFGDRCRFEHAQLDDFQDSGNYRSPQSRRNYHSDYQVQSRGGRGYHDDHGGYEDQSRGSRSYDNRGGYRDQSRGGRNYDNRGGFQDQTRGGRSYGGRQDDYQGSAGYGRHQDDYGQQSRSTRGYTDDQGAYGNYDRHDRGDQQSRYRYYADSNKVSGHAASSAASNLQSSDQRSTPAEILNWISEEMAIWENSGMWPFSSFAFARDLQSLPGLEDLSMEEIRFIAYEANASGKANDYLTWISQLYQDYKVKCQELLNPSASIRSSLINLIRDILHKDETEGNVTAAGQKAGAAQSIGSMSSSTFGSSSAASGFQQFETFRPPGATSSSAVNTATFGMSGMGGVPGPSFPSHFGPFSATPQSSNNFGQPSSLSSASQPAASSVFAASSTAGGPGLGAQPFAVASGAVAAAFPATGQHVAVPGQVQQAPISTYTPLSQLTSEEKVQFEAPKFTLGQIPTKPPPRELI